ncbi:hypothetical protein GCM10010483_42440 [Actinokineospora diospyrosa]
MAEGEAAPATTCTFFRVHSPDLGMSVLSRVNLADFTMQRIATLRYRVNAIAYSEDTNSLWGLSTRSTEGVFGDGAHVVSIGTDGDVIDHGPVRRVNELHFPIDRFTGATAGTIVGTTLVIRDEAAIYRIDLNPANQTYLGVVDAVMTYPGGQVSNVDDFDVRAGIAYGVAPDYHRSHVVRINITTGQVTRVDTPTLPGAASYGVAVLAPDGALYAAANSLGNRSPLFRIDLTTGASQEITAWPAVLSADATACLPGVEPATTPQTTPPAPQPQPQPPAPGPAPQRPAPAPIVTPATSPVISPTPIPIVPPPPTTAAPTPAPAPAPAESVRRPYRPQPTTEAPRVSARARSSTEEKRRWGLTTIVLLVGAGAAAAAGRRRRR